MYRFIRLGLRNVGRNRWQALLSVMGITLAVAFVIGITTIVTAVNQDFIAERRGDSAIDLTVHGRDAEWISFSDVKEQASVVKNVEVLSPAIIQTYNLTEYGAEGLITMYGLDPLTHPDWDSLSLVSGKKDLSNGNVFVSASIADQYDVKVGDSLDVAGFTITIGGIFDDQSVNSFARYPTGNLIIVNIEMIRSLLGRSDDEVTAVLVSVSDFLDVEMTYRQLLNTFSDEYIVILERTVNSFDRLVITAYGTTMTVVILITLFVEFIFLSNLFLIIVNEQQPNIGLMRALGMSRWQVALLFLIEISMYGLLGSVLGLYLGHEFSVSLLEYLLESQGLPIDNIPSLSFFDLLFALETGLLVSLLAGLYPTVVILKYTISRALYERRHMLTQSDKDAPMKKIFMIFGMAFLLVGIFLTFQASSEKSIEIRLDSSIALAMLAIFLGVFLLQLLAMWVLPGLIQRFGSVFSKFLIPISTRNIARYRVRSIASVATNAMALTFALTVIIITFTLAYHIPIWYQDTFPSTDIIVDVRDDQLLTEDVVNTFPTEFPLIEDLTYIKVGYGRYAGSTSEVIDVFGIQSSKFSKFSSKSFNEEKILELREVEADNSTVRAIITKSFAQAHFLAENDTFRLNLIYYNADISYINVKIFGIVSDNVFSLSSNSFQLYIDEGVLKQVHGLNFGIKYVLIDVSNDTRINEVISSLKSTYPEIQDVYSIQSRLEKLNRAINRQQTFLKALTYQAIIIAALTQFVAILLSAERGRYEIGIIRANGLDRTRVFMLFALEGMILGAIGLAMGWIDSVLASILLKKYIESLAGPMVILIPFDEILLWSALFLVIVFLATAYPGWRTATLPIIRSLDVRAQLFRSTISLKDVMKKTGRSARKIVMNYVERLSSPIGWKITLSTVIYLILGYFFIRTFQVALSTLFFFYLFYMFVNDDLKRFVVMPTMEKNGFEDPSTAKRNASETSRDENEKKMSIDSSFTISTSKQSLSFFQWMQDMQKSEALLSTLMALLTGFYVFLIFRLVDHPVRILLHEIFQEIVNPDLYLVSMAWLVLLSILVFFFTALMTYLVEYAFLHSFAMMMKESGMQVFYLSPIEKIRSVMERLVDFRLPLMKGIVRSAMKIVSVRFVFIFIFTVLTELTILTTSYLEVLSLIFDVLLGWYFMSLVSRHFITALLSSRFIELWGTNVVVVEKEKSENQKKTENLRKKMAPYMARLFGK